MAAKKDKLESFKKGHYSLIRVEAKVSPIIYKDMLESMELLGIGNETTYIIMALKNLNDRQLGRNTKIN